MLPSTQERGLPSCAAVKTQLHCTLLTVHETMFIEHICNVLSLHHIWYMELRPCILRWWINHHYNPSKHVYIIISTVYHPINIATLLCTVGIIYDHH